MCGGWAERHACLQNTDRRLHHAAARRSKRQPPEVLEAQRLCRRDPTCARGAAAEVRRLLRRDNEPHAVDALNAHHRENTEADRGPDTHKLERQRQHARA